MTPQPTAADPDGGGAFHVHLRREVAAGGVGVPDGVDDGELPGPPQRHERGHRGMESEAGCGREDDVRGEAEPGPCATVGRVVDGGEDLQSVRRAAQEDHDEHVARDRSGRGRRPPGRGAGRGGHGIPGAGGDGAERPEGGQSTEDRAPGDPSPGGVLAEGLGRHAERRVRPEAAARVVGGLAVAAVDLRRPVGAAADEDLAVVVGVHRDDVVVETPEVGQGHRGGLAHRRDM